MSNPIRITGEFRTDYDCELIGAPSERWAEAVFKVEDEELIFEVSAEETGTIVGIMIGDLAWKGTLKGFKEMLEKNK